MSTSAAKPATDLMDIVAANNDFRRVVATGLHEQIVVMTLKPFEEIGDEVHRGTDQVFMFIEGEGRAVLDGKSRTFDEGDLVFVPAGTRHNIINTGAAALRLITIYAPPEHAAGTVHATRADAEREEH